MKITSEQKQLAADTIGKNIAYYRNKRLKSQEELAEQAKIGAKHIGSIERGVKIPGSLTLSQLASALGVTLEDLMNGVSDIHQIKSFK